MNGAVGQVLPIAIVVMVSPIPIVGMILMLLSDRAFANAMSFLAAWFVSVGVVVLAVAVVAGAAARDDSSWQVWAGWRKIVFGLVLLALAVWEWRRRPRGHRPRPTPSWMAATARFTPPKAVALGVALGGLNPENFILALSGGSAIADAAPGDTATELVAVLVFAVVATLGVAAPLAIYFTAGDHGAGILGEVKSWMVRYNAAIMAGLLLLLGAKLIVDGARIL